MIFLHINWMCMSTSLLELKTFLFGKLWQIHKSKTQNLVSQQLTGKILHIFDDSHCSKTHLIMAFNCIIFVHTSALERQALCKGVRHWLSLVLTLALPFVIKTSTISAYPIKAAACKGDLFSESRLLTASGSFSRISSTSSMLPAIMACTRGGWKIQKSISVIWWNSIIVFFVILTSNFKSVILVKSGDKTSTDPLLLPAWARPQKF